MSAYPNAQSVARNSRPVLFLKRYLDEYSLRMSSAAVDVGPHESRVSLLGEGGTDNASHKIEDGDSRASSSPHMVKVLASASIGLLLLTLLVTESVVSGSFLGHSATAVSSGAAKPGVGCAGSHFVNAEVNNLQGYKISPECGENLRGYMEWGWNVDITGAMEAASDYLKSIPVRGDGRDVVVMGVDDSALSNLDFFREHKYGGDEYNETVWNDWIYKKRGVAHPKVLEVYEELKDAKVGIVFLSGRPERQRAITTENLIEAGFNAGWEDLILRTPEEEALTNREYKSQRRVELEGKGYRILFNVGDQWSDLLGPAKSRTFKIPNPMYYVY